MRGRASLWLRPDLPGVVSTDATRDVQHYGRGMPPSLRERPICPGCGEPIGVYEPLWLVDARIGAEATSWLDLLATGGGQTDPLWHAACAEAKGIEGG